MKLSEEVRDKFRYWIVCVMNQYATAIDAGYMEDYEEVEARAEWELLNFARERMGEDTEFSLADLRLYLSHIDYCNPHAFNNGKEAPLAKIFVKNMRARIKDYRLRQKEKVEAA